MNLVPTGVEAMKVTTSKAAAAIRQLNVAIELHFADRDPLAVWTLAAAGFGVLADLAERRSKGGSWREILITDSKLPRNQALRVLNSAANFLKHADRDPEASLELEEEEADHLIFIATLECAQLGERLSVAMQVFQVWYLAVYPRESRELALLAKKAELIFGLFDKKARETQLREGKAYLEWLRISKGDKA